MNRRYALRTMAVPALALLWTVGCRQPGGGQAAPATSAAVQPGGPAASRPANGPVGPNRPDEQTVRPVLPERPRQRPARPATKWARFVEPFDAERDAVIVETWTGGNRLEVQTQNVRRIVLDLRSLPDGAPLRPPWNLQIDDQGIEVTGRRGMRLELTRSDTGAWVVTGPKPRSR